MTAEQNKVFTETQGLLVSCGCQLESIGGDLYQIVRSGTGEVLGTGTLETVFNAAAYMSGSGKFKPEPIAAESEAYKAGLAMAEKLNQGK